MSQWAELTNDKVINIYSCGIYRYSSVHVCIMRHCVPLASAISATLSIGY